MKARWNIHLDDDVVGGGDGSPPVHPGGQDGIQVHRFGLPDALHPGGGEQRVEHTMHRLRLVDRDRVCFAGVRTGQVGLQALHGQPEARQGIAQLVGGVRDEGSLSLQGPFDGIHHRVERRGQPA